MPRPTWPIHSDDVRLEKLEETEFRQPLGSGVAVGVLLMEDADPTVNIDFQRSFTFGANSRKIIAFRDIHRALSGAKSGTRPENFPLPSAKIFLTPPHR